MSRPTSFYSSAKSFIRISFVGITIIIQLYAIGHIIYSKLAHQRQENEARNATAAVLSPQSSSAGRSRRHQEEQQQQQPRNNTANGSKIRIIRNNDQAYNKILFDVLHMFFLLAMVMIGAVSKFMLDGTSVENYPQTSPLSFYWYDFGRHIVLSLGFPLLFYFSHPEARQFVLGMFKKSNQQIQPIT